MRLRLGVQIRRERPVASGAELRNTLIQDRITYTESRTETRENQIRERL
jgi:hypothetical protein